MKNILVGLHGSEQCKKEFINSFPIGKYMEWEKEWLMYGGVETLSLIDNYCCDNIDLVFVNELLPGDINPDEHECYFLWLRDEPIGLCNQEMLKYDVTLNIKNTQKLEKIKNILIK